MRMSDIPLTGRRRRQSSGATIFAPALPSSLPGLVAWHEAEDIATGGGSPFSSWPNRAIPALTADQAGIIRPSLLLNAFDAQPAALFDGTDYLVYSGAALDWFAGTPGYTILAVIRPGAMTFGQVFNFLTSVLSARVAAQISNPGQPGANMNVVSQAPDGVSIGPTNKFTDPAFNAYVAGEPFLYTASADVPKGIIYAEKNGVEVLRTTVANGGPSYAPIQGGFSAASSMGGAIGARPDGNAAYNGQIGALVVWNRPYTHAELASVEAYLKQKYGLPPAIPQLVDTFNRANAATLGAADTGQVYTAPFGAGTDMTISGNRAASAALAFSIFNTGLNDFSMRFNIPTVGTKPIIGFRGTTGLNNLQVFFFGGRIQLTEFVGGGYPNPLLVDIPGVVANGDKIEIICKGNQITFLQNGVVKFISPAGLYQTGGLIGLGNNGTLTEYDNLIVTPV